MMGKLPYQVGTMLLALEEEGSTKILSSAMTTESGTNSTISVAIAEKSSHSNHQTSILAMRN